MILKFYFSGLYFRIFYRVYLRLFDYRCKARKMWKSKDCYDRLNSVIEKRFI